jgi:uncharacterized integral membrane protein
MSTGRPGGKGLSRLDSSELARYGVIVALVVYGALFVILNTHKVGISFVFFTVHVPVLFALLLACAIGMLVGWLLHERLARTPKHPPR